MRCLLFAQGYRSLQVGFIIVVLFKNIPQLCECAADLRGGGEEGSAFAEIFACRFEILRDPVRPDDAHAVFAELMLFDVSRAHVYLVFDNALYHDDLGIKE